ncbi:MAG: SDR family oxidoreductase [Nitratireductor sp.]|nr:SDR family oxidoreductase [Nitratireductor sp.]MCC0020926.1 SDR family oxidoreductase [Nitratireductor sp.]
MANKLRLEGKRVLATAAAAGIGRATAIAMANEGAKVFATDVNEAGLKELAAENHPNIETFVLDVRSDDSVAEAAGRAEPDILFNCAGFVHNGTILDCTDEEWDFAFDLNVRSMFRTIRATLPGMLDRGGGAIVNIASVASSVIGAPSRFIYGTTKASVIGLTKSVAKDFVTRGIRCNAICPGTVDSPSLHERLKATGDYDAALKAFIARQPMGRIGTPEEIAALALYLASEEAGFTTGQIHVVDGGWTG